MRVASDSAALSRALSVACGSPLPPGSIASMIAGSTLRSRSTRNACMRIVNMLGIALGVAMTKGMKPSQMPRVFSALPMVWYEPPLPPNR